MISNVNALDVSKNLGSVEALNNVTVNEQNISALIDNANNVNAQDVVEFTQNDAQNVSAQGNEEGAKKYQLTAEFKDGLKEELAKDKKVYDKKVAEMEEIEKQITALSNEVSI